MGSILHILARNPQLTADAKLKFKDTRQNKTSYVGVFAVYMVV